MKKEIYRQKKLENLGITFLRFRDEDDLGRVVHELKNWVKQNKNNLKGRL